MRARPFLINELAAISFFSMLVEPLIALPQLLRCVNRFGRDVIYTNANCSAVAIALTSWNRIYTFLIAAESPVNFSEEKNDNTEPIRIEDGSFQWSKKCDAEVVAVDEKTRTFIHDVNISIKKGSLTAIVGNVGSGKSSILSAMLGEMECVSGQVGESCLFPIFIAKK